MNLWQWVSIRWRFASHSYHATARGPVWAFVGMAPQVFAPGAAASVTTVLGMGGCGH